jgi:hypothetical protein
MLNTVYHNRYVTLDEYDNIFIFIYILDGYLFNIF